MTTLPPTHHPHHEGNDHSLLNLSPGHLASAFVSVLVAGVIGSFSLLWSMSHSLTRINEKLDALYGRLQNLDSAQAAIQREFVLLERRLSILEEKVGVHGR